MRIWFAGPRIGFFRPGVSFNVGGGRRPRQQEPTPAPVDFVYVIAGAHGLTKVGISTDPSARLATLQTGSPERLWLAFTAPGYGNAFTIEQEAHRILSAHRVSGEWFNITPDLAIAALFGAADRTGCSISVPAAPPETPVPTRLTLADFVIRALFIIVVLYALEEMYQAAMNHRY